MASDGILCLNLWRFQMNPFQLTAKIASITSKSELEEQYWQPVFDSEGDVISYADWEQKNKA